jgi:hypothetical protein
VTNPRFPMHKLLLVFNGGIILFHALLVPMVLAALHMTYEMHETWANAGISNYANTGIGPFITSPFFHFALALLFLTVIGKEFMKIQIKWRVAINSLHLVFLVTVLVAISAHLAKPIVDATNQLH